MSRAERLIELLESLRHRQYAVSGQVLAKELGVSLRTIYRDIATLQGQGAPIEGEAGVGFILRPGYFLPPMIFTTEEIEAIVLGTRWVLERGDEGLVKASHTALSKMKSVLPEALREKLERETLLIPIQSRPSVDDKLAASMRKAISEESIADLQYRDTEGALTERSIWPFALAYHNEVLILMAWCELRQDFRHFRADRIESWVVSQRKYKKSRLTLLSEWQEKEGIPPHSFDL